MLTHFDYIYVLQHGSIVDQGTFANCDPEVSSSRSFGVIRKKKRMLLGEARLQLHRVKKSGVEKEFLILLNDISTIGLYYPFLNG